MKKKTWWLLEGTVVIFALMTALTVMIPKFMEAQHNINTPNHIPDPNFRKAIEIFMGVESGDPILKDEAKAKNGKLDCSNMRIKSLQGIEYFPNIQILSCGNNEISEIKFSENSQLNMLYCYNNQITNINFENVPRLHFLYCSNNKLQNVFLHDTPHLHTLDISNNGLTKVDLSVLPNLVRFNSTGNKLTSLDVSTNLKLNELLIENTQITQLDVTRNTALTKISCKYNNLKLIKFPFPNKIKNLDVGFNQFTVIDVTKLPHLRFFKCNNNLISKIHINNNSLYLIDICNNQINSLKDFKHLKSISYLDIQFNNLSQDDLIDIKQFHNYDSKKRIQNFKFQNQNFGIFQYEYIGDIYSFSPSSP